MQLHLLLLGLPPTPTEEPRPTPSELKSAFASHIAQRNGPDAPLMTKAMREREEARLGIKKKEYTEVRSERGQCWCSELVLISLLTHTKIRIRVRFSDRTMLEALFPADTQIPILYHFIRSHLAPKYATSSFTIYQSPPKRDLPERGDTKIIDKSIKDLGMAPQAIVNVRWSDTSMNANTFPAPLDSSILSQAKALPTPPSFESLTSDTTSRTGANGGSEVGSTSNGTTKKVSGQIPKHEMGRCV